MRQSTHEVQHTGSQVQSSVLQRKRNAVELQEDLSLLSDDSIHVSPCQPCLNPSPNSVVTFMNCLIL